MSNHILALFFLLCTLFAAPAMAQHPIGYGSLRATSQVATFAFDSLDCSLLKEKAAAIYLAEPIALTFEVLVDADGNVKYVRSPKMNRDLSELRLACTSALYDHQFSPVAPQRGERWFKATMVLEEN